jgi:hypothetical protein
LVHDPALAIGGQAFGGNRRAWWIRKVEMPRCTTASTWLRAAGWAARRNRSGNGNVSTHCLISADEVWIDDGEIYQKIREERPKPYDRVLEVKTGPIFKFEELVDAHKLMDANQAGGKIVIRGKK